jgi:ferrous iron transport protein B
LLNSEVAAQYEQAVNQEAFLNEYQQEHSYLGKIGKLTEPLVEPLGFDWKVSVSLLAGSAAKEVVVSTLGVLYTGQDDEVLLSQKLKANNPLTGKPNFTAISALAFLVFVLIYFPCIATIAAIVRETGSWLYGAFSIVYNTGLAWLLAFAIYQIGNML